MCSPFWVKIKKIGLQVHNFTLTITIAYTHVGDAYFYGVSVRWNLDVVRSILGVCPQHDILWEDLTAKEHMELFGNLKDIPKQQMQNEIGTLLKEVQLNQVSLCSPVVCTINHYLEATANLHWRFV